jgi:uncharacterized linocin/CFP29 family protein
MPDDVAGLPWTEEQWAAVRRTVQEAAGKARVASSFLPLVGPLGPGQASVPSLSMDTNVLGTPQRGEAANRFEIDDGETLPLNTLSCEVHLTTQQVEDPDLASARELLGRAAGIIGRLEDAIIFNGHPGGEAPPQPPPEPRIYRVNVPRRPTPGLLNEVTPAGGLGRPPARLRVAVKAESQNLIEQVDAAISVLEGNGHYGPFACVLGRDLYRAAITPETSLAIARDRILALLGGGPLHRSSLVPLDQGVVISLAASPIDLVVASDVHVKLLQVTLEPRYVFRISERFVLRLKQPDARCCLVPPRGLAGGAAGASATKGAVVKKATKATKATKAAVVKKATKATKATKAAT